MYLALTSCQNRLCPLSILYASFPPRGRSVLRTVFNPAQLVTSPSGVTYLTSRLCLASFLPIYPVSLSVNGSTEFLLAVQPTCLFGQLTSYPSPRCHPLTQHSLLTIGWLIILLQQLFPFYACK